MRGISPPLDSKINGPDGVEDVVGEKHVGKIKHMLRILLCEDNVSKRGGCGADEGANVMDGTNSPRKADEGEGGVNV
jgi:hypothetical protein